MIKRVQLLKYLEYLEYSSGVGVDPQTAEQKNNVEPEIVVSLMISATLFLKNRTLCD